MDFKYMIIRASSALLLLSGPLFTACDDDDPDAFITVSKQEIEVEYNGLTANGETVNFDLGSNHAWQATYVEEWIHPTHTEGDRGRTRIFLAIDENDTGKDREGYVIFEGGGSRRTVAVTQKLKIDALMVSPGKLTVVRSGLLETGEKASVYISANSDWTIETSGDSGWITPSKTSGKAGEEDVELTIAPNTTGAVRTGAFVVTAGSKKATVTVTQNLEGLKVSAASFKVNKFGFADEDRVVLRAPRKDLQHAANLLVTADHRVELARTRLLVQVDGVLAQRVELLFGGLRIDRRPLAEGPDSLDQLLFRGAVAFEDVGGRAALGHERQQQMFDRSVLVAEVLREVHGALDRFRSLLGEELLAAALDPRQRTHGTLRLVAQRTHVHTDAPQQERRQRIVLTDEDTQQMERFDSLLSPLPRKVERRLQRLLRLDG